MSDGIGGVPDEMVSRALDVLGTVGTNGATAGPGQHGGQPGEWKADFLGAFPDLAARDRWKGFQPKPENANSWSCRDKLPN
ncbi:hypothetical protein [Nocardia tengchongensis]